MSFPSSRRDRAGGCSTSAWWNVPTSFAAAGAFGAESELAAPIHGQISGQRRSRTRGRQPVPGVLAWQRGWQRDVNSPDGDRRFFKEKLDELPPDMLAEVRRRNGKYIVWLAEHLRG